MPTIDSGEKLKKKRHSLLDPATKQLKPTTDMNVSFTKEYFRAQSLMKQNPASSLGPGNRNYRKSIVG